MQTPMNLLKHPLHPMLIPFPIGLLVFSLVCDVAILFRPDLGFGTVSLYCMAGGILSAMAAALPGLLDWLSLPKSRARRVGLWHLLLNGTVTGIFIVDFYLRVTAVPETLPRIPFLLSILGIVLLTVSGWFGGEMVYVHGVGVVSGASAETE